MLNNLDIQKVLFSIDWTSTPKVLDIGTDFLDVETRSYIEISNIYSII